ncbi:MAG TPA: hypothetical protein VFV52_15670 [Bacilli bacterium]|nr:hypothetical protein [Bacilli bacterium]
METPILSKGQTQTHVNAEDIYNPAFNLGTLSEQQKANYMRHTFTNFPTVLVIVLHFLTGGIFSFIYLGLKHSQVPMIKANDFSAGKAIGFMFIPFFNLYWIFMFHVRLVNRINLQFRLRGQQEALSTGFAITVLILSFIPFVNLINVILYPVLIGQIQSACNRLADQQ